MTQKSRRDKAWRRAKAQLRKVIKNEHNERSAGLVAEEQKDKKQDR